MDQRLLEIIACPICKGELHFKKSSLELVCSFDKLAYPIHDGIPVLLENQSRPLIIDEKLN